MLSLTLKLGEQNKTSKTKGRRKYVQTRYLRINIAINEK